MRNGVTKPDAPAEPLADTAVVRKRREEIVSAAMEIIATEGIHRLSLARIESRVHMSRGQLTYYFRSKEKILLAVFDQMLAKMMAENMREAEQAGFKMEPGGPVLDKLSYGLRHMMEQTAGHTEKTHLLSVVYTFLAQLHHRPDFRAKLAEADASWRGHIAADVTASVPRPRHSPEVVASIIMALFQGLGNQLAVNPQAFDPALMANAVLQAVEPLLGVTNAPENAHG